MRGREKLRRARPSIADSTYADVKEFKDEEEFHGSSSSRMTPSHVHSTIQIIQIISKDRPSNSNSALCYDSVRMQKPLSKAPNSAESGNA